MKKVKKKIRERIFTILGILSFILTGGADAEDVLYKYQKLLIEKINNPVLQDIVRENNVWEKAKEISARYIGSTDDVQKPVTLVVYDSKYLDYSKGLRGVYEPEMNIVIATDYEVLLHEYLHAIFYLTGNEALAGDESFIRALDGDI